MQQARGRAVYEPKPRNDTPGQSRGRGQKHPQTQRGGANSSRKPGNAEPQPFIGSLPSHDSAPVLLTDEAIKSFLVNGFILLKPSQLSSSFHQYIYQHMENNPVAEKSGNNCLPAIPALNQVYEDPVVKGALQSILGKDFGMHPHRAVHLTPPGKREQQWHRDSFWGYKLPIRFPLPWMAMAMYYPQETTLQMGPTGAKPATQYFTIDPKRYNGPFPNHFKENDSWDFPLVCPQGSVCIIHYDLVHKGLGNNSAINRYMFKFQFYRNTFPSAPDWNCQSLKWTAMDLKEEKKLSILPVCQAVWEWMCGASSVFEPPQFTEAEKSQFIKELDAQSEWTRFKAAFQLSLSGSLDILIKRLSHSDPQLSLCAAHAVAATPRRYYAQYSDDIAKIVETGANDSKIPAMWILSEWGKADLILKHLKGILAGKYGSTNLFLKPLHRPSLRAITAFLDRLHFLCSHLKCSILRHNPNVRIMCVQTAGRLTQCDEEIVNILSNILQNEADEQVRMLASMALNCLGSKMSSFPPLKALLTGLNDSQRYIQGYSISALLKIQTPEATELAMKYLIASRWCPITTPASPY